MRVRCAHPAGASESAVKRPFKSADFFDDGDGGEPAFPKGGSVATGERWIDETFVAIQARVCHLCARIHV